MTDKFDEMARDTKWTWSSCDIAAVLRRVDAEASARGRAMAVRAVRAILEDPAIGISMVDDMEERIERAVDNAAETKNDDAAIERAAKNMVPNE